nr:MAG TPA: DNA polymerase I [Caudoviricetes sp.]
MKDFERLFLDTETFSGVDLKKVGAYAYAEHPTTEIMICTYAIDEGRVQTWDATESPTMPRELRKALRQVSRKKAKIVMANGLLFDRLVIREKWGIDLPVSQIEDTMIMAFRHALPGSLDMQCQVLGVDADHAKDKAGKALIKRFCKPTPKTYKIRRYTRETHPEEWAKFLRYAALDIVAMREVYWRIPDWGNTPKEDEILLIDQLINDRGFYVDVDLARAAIKAVQAHKEELKEEAWERFGGKLTGNDFLPALRDLAPAFTIHNAQKSTLNDLLEDPDFPDEGKVLIEMRLGASSTASTKYNPLVNGLSADGRRRGCLQYGGAKRTLRWAGKGFQPQNLARGEYSDDHEGKIKRRDGESDVSYWVRSHMLTNGINSLLRGTAHWAYDISKLTASTVRGCIIPANGKKFVVADYSNVEGRGLAWIAGEKNALMVFKAGRDIYCETAGKMFGLDPEYIKANRKDLRQIGKACLYHRTQVLTNTGFKDVSSVTRDDKVWNGDKWVGTDGARFMGWKPVINVDGVYMTEDHRILAHSWEEAKQLASEKGALRCALDTGSDAHSRYRSWCAANNTNTHHGSVSTQEPEWPSVPVYDLINVEDGNRFLIKSESGYLVSHNCELGLGYGGGVAAFLQFAKNLGLDLYAMADVMKGTFPDHIWAAAKRGYEYARINEAKRPPKPGKKDERPTYILPKNVWLTCDAIKRMWRESHPKTVAFWAELEDAVLCAIRNPGKAYWAGANVRPDGKKALKIVRTKAKHDPTFDEERDDPNAAGWWLKIELPSGRIMSYPGIALSVTTEIDEDTGKKRTSTRIKYQGENQTTRQWGFQYTYGGKLTENIVQALCRDILAWSMPGVESAGYEIVLSVHDELITEVPDTDDYTTEELCALMCDLPVWAKGFPLAAEGECMMRYRK